MADRPDLFGIAAEFDSPGPLLEAVRKARNAGFSKLEAYTPHPVEGLSEALDFEDRKTPFAVLIGGLLGAAGGFGMQVYSVMISYPWNIGGRPAFSWPAFIPITFELGVLCASIAGLVVMLGLNGLPRPHHPLFSMEGFNRASQDRYFLCVEAEDPNFEVEKVRQFLEDVGPIGVREVPRE